MNYNKLKLKIEKNNFTINSISGKIEMTAQGLSAAMKNDTLKIKDLEKIAGILKIDVREFFGEKSDSKVSIENNSNGGDNHINIGSYQEKIKHLEEMLAEKEKRLILLEKFLDKS